MTFTHQTTGRLSGALFLFVFISGVAVYQFLRGPYLFADDYLTETATHANEVITSIILAFINGTIGVGLAVWLYPVFRKVKQGLALLYLALSLFNFTAIMLENYAAIGLLSVSEAYVFAKPTMIDTIGGDQIAHRQHELMHYCYLLLSCLPVFVLYLILFNGRLIPRAISVFGMLAAGLMLAGMLLSIYGISGGDNLLLPMGLVQLILPFWLLVKGFRPMEKVE